MEELDTSHVTSWFLLRSPWHINYLYWVSLHHSHIIWYTYYWWAMNPCHAKFILEMQWDGTGTWKPYSWRQGPDLILQSEHQKGFHFEAALNKHYKYTLWNENHLFLSKFNWNLFLWVQFAVSYHQFGVGSGDKSSLELQKIQFTDAGFSVLSNHLLKKAA